MKNNNLIIPDRDVRITDPIKGRDGYTYVLIEDVGLNNEVRKTLRLKSHLIAEQALDGNIFPHQFVEFVDGNKENYDLMNLRVRERKPEDPFPDLETRDVPSHKDIFMVTDQADLVSKRTNKILSQTQNRNGYLCHSTKVGGRNGIDLSIRVHRAVAEAFIPNPENKPEVNHVTGIKTDNLPDQLEWTTPKENMQHAYANGLVNTLKGENVSSAKFTNEQIREIRESKEKITHLELALKHNVSRSTITDIINNKTYIDV